jgi:LPPG:FO 2-phospho-L-lactate transferase
VVAVSPIIGGQAVKGPAAKMFTEMGITPSALAVASQYKGVIQAFVLDHVDAGQVKEIETLGIQTYTTDIMMRDVPDRQRLAQELLEIVDKVRL